MKFSALVLGLSLVIPFALNGADAPSPGKPSVGEWDFTPDPTLPNVLLLGDSISIGYTREVRMRLRGRANIYRPLNASRQGAENCRDTRFGLERIDAWLLGRKWDVIHFNWGLWDFCYRNPAGKISGNRDKKNGTIAVPMEEYIRNIDRLVARLRATEATLIWASTTVIPPDEPGRFVGDALRYNAAAAAIMARHKIAIDDLHAVSAAFPPAYFRAPADVHPNEEGSSRLADAVAGAVLEALARSGKNQEKFGERTAPRHE